MPLHKLMAQTSFAEARRVLEICSVCDYCSGFCEMFRAANRRPEFSDADVRYLAHLCHDCGNCLKACQYAPPHVFDIDPPKVMAEARAQSWRTTSWTALLPVPLAPVLTVAFVPADILLARHTGPGAFYAVAPWALLCLLAGAALLWSLVVLCVGVWRFWRDSGGGDPRRALGAALGDILVLRNLKGGGIPCDHGGVRRWAHHGLVLGFALCFASTCVATVYHHLWGYQAPYPFLSMPVVLGSVGGGLMMLGCAGLLASRMRRNRSDGGVMLLGLLLAVSGSGFALLIWRDTMAMGLLLAFHLGTVLSLFLSISTSKLAHAAYRSAALLRAALERIEQKRKRKEEP